MDQGWDHTENEDKLMLGQALGMDRDMGKDMYRSEVRSVSSSGCYSVSNVSYGDGLTSLSGEYKNQLLSIAINNFNYTPISNSSFIFFFNNIFSIDFYNYFVNPVDTIYSNIVSIYRQFQSCNSTCTSKCECTCKCESPCNGNFICLCICSCSSSSSGSSNGCCICICKHKDCNSKCICICVCKNGDKCCCQSKEHQCKECLIKVDINSLLIQTWQISGHLNWIRCCISRLDNQSGSDNTCCCCSCCPSGCSPESCQSYCCCKDGEVNYLTIMSRINSVEFLFKEVGTKMVELRELKNTLSLISLIATKCESCGNCCKDLDSLIDYIEKALRYYYLFGSRIDDIRSFVEYKINYNKSKEIISSIEKSIKCFPKQLSMINNHIVDSTINNNSVVQANKLLIGVYSSYNIFQCYVVINRLIQCEKKIDQILQLVPWPDGCRCILGLEWRTSNKIDLGRLNVQKIIEEMTKENNKHNDLKLDKIRTLIQNDIKDNHVCLCMVIKYLLYPQIIKLINIIGMDLTVLSTISKKFSKYGLYTGSRLDLHQFLIIMVDILEWISNWIRTKYYYTMSWTSGGNGIRVDIKCFCMYSDDPSYSRVISILLVLSSLIENIWAMDTQNIKIATEKISSLYSQLESYDLYSLNDTKKLSCNSLYTLLLNKDCKKPCQSTEGGKCCCCWCVTCFNLVVMCVSLCLQCKLCKAICNNEGKSNGCEKFKEYFKKLECKCECKCPEKNGLCCLLKLALSKGGDCSEELTKTLEKCCEQCNGKDDCCCKKILDMVKKGLCKILLLGCCCNGDKCECGKGDVKTCCLLFGNECNSVAVVVFCKCKGEKCCCLTEQVDKLKDKLKNVCEGQKCVCEELKNCEKLCCGTGCGDGCVCKKLQESLKTICKGDGEKCNGGGECLCKLITETFKKCTEGACQCCKDKEGGCRCVCWKIVGMSIKILTRACKANVLEPYKRVVIELMASSKDKKDVIKTIVEGINATTLNNIYLVKNSYSSYPYSVGSYEATIDGVTNVETRNWGYDTKYEHDVSTDKGFTYNYPDISNNTASYASSRSSNKPFKMIISRMLVGGVIVFVFIYIRLTIIFF